MQQKRYILEILNALHQGGDNVGDGVLSSMLLNAFLFGSEYGGECGVWLFESR